jgi:hypothetical protein
MPAIRIDDLGLRLREAIALHMLSAIVRRLPVMTLTRNRLWPDVVRLRAPGSAIG